jgi:hypothetical protein
MTAHRVGSVGEASARKRAALTRSLNWAARFPI